MDGKMLAGFLNKVSGGVDLYGYDEQSDRIIVVEKDNLNHTTIMSIEKAENELKKKACDMLETIKQIMEETIPIKAAGNNAEIK